MTLRLGLCYWQLSQGSMCYFSDLLELQNLSSRAGCTHVYMAAGILNDCSPDSRSQKSYSARFQCEL